jgi:hypothetical protein
LLTITLLLTNQEDLLIATLLLTNQEDLLIITLILTNQEDVLIITLILTNQEDLLTITLLLTNQEDLLIISLLFVKENFCSGFHSLSLVKFLQCTYMSLPAFGTIFRITGDFRNNFYMKSQSGFLKAGLSF